jgi:spermidine/putrescine transport system substrate-binding protein
MRRKVGETVDESWGLFFDPKKQPGSIMLLDSQTDVIRAVLQYKGYDFNSIDPKDLKEVRDILIETKKRSLGFANSVATGRAVLGKSARAAITYSGTAAEAIREDAELHYFIPKEGGLIWVDSVVILRKAPHLEMAHKFINFILEPEISAKISNTHKFATPNREAKKFIEPELLRDAVSYPPEETMGRLQFAKNLGRNSRLHDQVWTSVKSN